IPQFDQAMAFAIACATAFLLGAAEERRASVRVALAIVGGLFAGLALFVSYGSLAFLAVAGLMVLAQAGVNRQTLSVGILAVSVALAVQAAIAFLGPPPLAPLRTALAIHHEPYPRPRSYALWLGFALLDLALFLGPPVAALFVGRIARSPVA